MRLGEVVVEEQGGGGGGESVPKNILVNENHVDFFKLGRSWPL